MQRPWTEGQRVRAVRVGPFGAAYVRMLRERGLCAQFYWTREHRIALCRLPRDKHRKHGG